MTTDQDWIAFQRGLIASYRQDIEHVGRYCGPSPVQRAAFVKLMQKYIRQAEHLIDRAQREATE
jgi:hypothetical protein